MTDLDVTFTMTFGTPPHVTARAPGRVNLIGEHGDDTGGLLLPVAIPQETRVALARREGRTVRAATDALGCSEPVTFELGNETKRGIWIDYVQGSVIALRDAGHEVHGFDVQFASNVPIAAGLSSSAALEIALLRGLRAAFALDIDDVMLAKIGRAAETDFVGREGGLMGPLAASLADIATALFVDRRTLDWHRLPLPGATDIVVIDSGVAHARRAGDHAKRRAECERAARELGVSMLRDVVDPAKIATLPDPLARRARHVISENARVLEAAACLRSGDVERLGEVLGASHASLRDDYEVSVPAVDRLVELAQLDEDVYGARMTGGGFGGAVVALARRGRAPAVATRIIAAYGRGARALVPFGTTGVAPG